MKYLIGPSSIQSANPKASLRTLYKKIGEWYYEVAVSFDDEWAPIKEIFADPKDLRGAEPISEAELLAIPALVLALFERDLH